MSQSTFVADQRREGTPVVTEVRFSKRLQELSRSLDQERSDAKKPPAVPQVETRRAPFAYD